MNSKRYYAELEPDARGFTTFLEVEVLDGKVTQAYLDGKNFEPNPYGLYKTKSEKYNNDMHVESGTYYRDATKILEKDILENKKVLRRVKGAKVLSANANELLGKIRKEMNN